MVLITPQKGFNILISAVLPIPGIKIKVSKVQVCTDWCDTSPYIVFPLIQPNL